MNIIVKRSGFTLAEVLITLSIIGVVAALTIPSLIANNQKKEYTTGMMKAYSVIQSLIGLSQADNGPITSWDWASVNSSAGVNNLFQTHIKPYLNIMNDCDTTKNGCFKNTTYQYLDGSNWVNFYNANPLYYRFTTTDGMNWMFQPTANCVANKKMCGGFYVDVNGEKGPNKYGRDTFLFVIMPLENKISPHAHKNIFREDSQTFEPIGEEEMNQTCNTSSKGEYCTAKIIFDGQKMNY